VAGIPQGSAHPSPISSIPGSDTRTGDQPSRVPVAAFADGALAGELRHALVLRDCGRPHGAACSAEAR